MLKRQAGEKTAFDGLGVITGDAEDDEVQRIRLGRVDSVQQRLGGGELRSACRPA